MKSKNTESRANNTEDQTVTLDSDSSQDQAREWLTYLYTADVSPGKHDEFIRWINNSDENRQKFKLSQKLWQTIGMTDSAVDWLEQHTHQISVLPLKSTRKHRLPKLVALLSSIAASIVLLAMNGVFITTDSLKTPVTETVFTSPIGENRSFTLSDGSEVTLAGNSSITVDLGQHKRQVKLRKGSAYFAVSHDSSRVFSVTVQNTQVRVRGTEFEIRLATDSVIKISVKHGLVDVVDMTEDGIVDEQVLQLHANEQLWTNMNGAFITDATLFDPETEFSWLNKRLTYDNVPLKDVIMDINRYVKKPVVILDESLNEFPITASFTFKQIDQMLASLSEVYPITLIEEDTRNILTKQ
jgi:transmembrane sensor